jgi:NAD(P)-dependent dehydrogenase (short-subunit alcohol dehydrogenase family)
MEKSLRIVVIGGSSGMGLAVAKLMHTCGYQIVIASRSKEKLEKARKEIGEAEVHVLDLMKEAEVSSFFSKVGPFDHLFTPAADFFMGPFLGGKTEGARKYFDGKFWGQYCAAKYGAPHIRKGGSITFFSGAANEKPMMEFTAGCAINAAIEALGRALALELSPIRVNTISPGVIVSPLWDIMPKGDQKAFFEQIAGKLPAKRVGHTEDIAKAARYLAECPYATGSVVAVDGGYALV